MVDGELGLKEAIKCLVNESPGRLPPLPSGPRPVNVYPGLVCAGEGERDRAGGAPSIPRGATISWGSKACKCLLTFGRQTRLVASWEEEEEEEEEELPAFRHGLLHAEAILEPWSGDASHLLVQVPNNSCMSPALTIPATPPRPSPAFP